MMDDDSTSAPAMECAPAGTGARHLDARLFDQITVLLNDSTAATPEEAARILVAAGLDGPRDVKAALRRPGPAGVRPAADGRVKQAVVAIGREGRACSGRATSAASARIPML